MIAETIFSQLFGKAVHEMAAGQTDPFARTLMQWLAEVQGHVIRRWRPVAASGIRCALKPKDQVTGQFAQCPVAAIGACGVCGRPVCLHHAMIGQQADILCTACLSEFVRSTAPERPEQPAAAPAPPSEQELRRRHLRVLGLREPSSWAIIHAAFRKKAAKMHPDRARPQKREEAESKFKTLNEAYQWLRSRYEKAA